MRSSPRPSHLDPFHQHAGLRVLSVEGGAPDVDGGGVLDGSHVYVMSLCRRFFRQDLRLLDFSIRGLVVRPPGLATLSKTPRAPSMKGTDDGVKYHHHEGRTTLD